MSWLDSLASMGSSAITWSRCAWYTAASVTALYAAYERSIRAGSLSCWRTCRDYFLFRSLKEIWLDEEMADGAKFQG